MRGWSSRWAIIVGGGFAILTRLKLLHVAVAFWVTFAAGLGLLDVTGHAMSARWHIGPVTDFYFWWILVTSPEILVFLFFMISDPKTIPESRRGRIAYAVAVGILATTLIAASKTEFWAKVAVLGALTVVCLAWPLLKRWAPQLSASWPKLALAGAAVLALWARGSSRPASARGRSRSPRRSPTSAGFRLRDRQVERRLRHARPERRPGRWPPT